MIKTTLAKLKQAYSTLSFAPRALGLETNGKFYKLIVTILRRADKSTKPDITEEEECERGEVIAKLMLEPSDTAALFSRGLSKPEALQKASFLAPPVEYKQREKSTLSNENQKQIELNNPECNSQEVALSMCKSIPHPVIQPEPQVNEAPQTVTQTHRQETVFSETKKSEPPNSLQNAIPDIIVDKNDPDECPDGKTSDQILCSPEKENSNGNKVNNLQNSTGPDKVNNMLRRKRVYNQSRLYNKDSDSPSIKFFASYDKTKKPPSTETNSSLDELAKHCLDSPNNKIDERLLKEMKKLGVPQTSSRSENSAIEENIIQMDVLRKPRKPTEKTEIEVETRKFEHPPLHYSDEQRLEFKPSTAEKDGLLGAMRKNKKSTLVLSSQFCDIRPPPIDIDKPLLNPFDKRNIKLDDESSHDVEDTKNYYHTKAPGAVQLEKTNEPLKSFLNNSRNYNDETDKPLEFHKLSENKPDNEIGRHKPIENPSNPLKLSMVSEDNVENANSTPSKKSNAHQMLDLPKHSENKAYHNLLNQDANSSVADEPNEMFKMKIDSTPLNIASGVDFQAEGELPYSDQQSDKKAKNRKRKFENSYDPVPKQPEPLMVFNPQQGQVNLSVHTNQLESEGDLGTDHNVEYIQNLRSLRVRCNVLPTKHSDEKATISLLVEIDAYKQPKEEFAPRHQPDVTYRENSADHQKEERSINLKQIDHITRDKVTMILPETQESTNEGLVDSPPEVKPEIPLSEMLKRVRSRNRAEYCQQLEKSLELNTEVETMSDRCGNKKPNDPPRCPPQKSRCPSPCTPASKRPACPRPCRPAGPPPCPPPCPKSVCPPCGKKKYSNPCGSGSGSSRKGGNPCCPGSGSSRRGGNPCCPGSSRKGGNPCCPGSSSSPRNPCKFSTHLPSIMMNGIVSLIDQRSTMAESELGENQLFKDAYQRLLVSAVPGEFYRPNFMPILNICGITTTLGNYESESVNSTLARDYDPWVPIPCLPESKKEDKKPLICPNKGCPIPLPGNDRPPCKQCPCRRPKRKNTFSIVDLYERWSNSNGRQ